MVNNYDRILTEIKEKARRFGPEYGIEPNALVDLTMKIVDIEDQNRTKKVARIKQRVEELILQTATIQLGRGER